MRDPLLTPARVAFAGDWHGNDRWAQVAITYAKLQGADVIVHLGDFGYRYPPTFLQVVSETLAQRGIPLIFVDGNHDDHPWLLRRRKDKRGLRPIAPHLWHLPRGFRWLWGDTTFLALGGAVSIDRHLRVEGESWWPTEEITARQANLAIAGGPVDVLISHDAPRGVEIPGLLDPATLPYGALLLADAHRVRMRWVVDRVMPRAIFHGHYHSAYTARPDFGYGPVHVQGLDCDGTSLRGNVEVLDLAALRPATG